MDSAIGYIIDSVGEVGLPVIVSLIAGFVIGYLFFRSRAQDEREAIVAIKQAKTDSDGKAIELGEKLQEEESKNQLLEAEKSSLEATIAELEKERGSLKAQVDYWRSRAADDRDSANGPFESGLNTFLR